MALLFYTGFDYYDETQTNRIWSYSNNGVSLVPGRFGGRGWLFNNTDGFLSKLLPGASTTTIGLAFSFSFGDATNPFLIFQDATNSRTNPINQVDIRITSDGAFQVTRNGTVLGTTSPFLVTFDRWNYLEIKTFINHSTGFVVLRLNGQTFLNLGSQNTQTSGNNFVNMIRLQPFATTGNYNFKIDDIYVLDDTGVPPSNNFLGECRTLTLFPISNGEVNNFSVIGATNNWEAVSETVSDDDVSYVRNGSANAIDDYNFDDANVTGTIFGLQQNITFRKDDVGVRTITPILHSNGQYYEGSIFTCESDWLVAQKLWELEPSSLTPWDNTSINAITAGIKIKA